MQPTNLMSAAMPLDEKEWCVKSVECGSDAGRGRENSAVLSNIGANHGVACEIRERDE